MLKLYGLSVLLGVDHAVADTGELGVLVHLDIILFQVLEQACLGLGNCVGYDLGCHLYHGHIAALYGEEHCGFGAGHAAAGNDNTLSGQSSAAQYLDRTLDELMVIKSGDGQHERSAAGSEDDRIGLFLFDYRLGKRCRELYLNAVLFKLAAIVNDERIVLGLARGVAAASH